VLVLASVAAAQQADKARKSRLAPQAVVFGTVFQESGFVVRGARVVIFNAERPKEKKETTTDIQGEFAMRFPAGKASYTVEVSSPGFQTERKKAEVIGDERVELTFHLAAALK
jgi:hypothetical protein